MKIIINGQEKNIEKSQALSEIIQSFCKQTDRVIAEVNGQIIKGPSWNATQIKDGDSIELVSFVGGG